ncbi:MFS transporter, partial [Deinococcus pimensis]|uniref:MFS transporter n=1 Tax=Deinococcus pimensis TaxID=309888 RepID=UPI0012FB1DE2
MREPALVTDGAAPRPATSVLPALAGVAALFLTNGVLMGTWVTRIPLVKDALGLSDVLLGLSLLGVTLGSVLVLPFARGVLARHGPRGVAVTALVTAGAALLLATQATGLPALLVTLALFGAGFGAADVALNVVAVTLEHATRRSLMSRLHGTYSLGALLGALLGGWMVSLGASVLAHVGTVLVVLAAVLLSAGR